jgi:hypothetical protein
MAEVKVTVNDTPMNLTVEETEAVIYLGVSGPQGPRGSQLLSGEGDPSPVIGLIGDHYIQTSNGKLFGPKTSSGWGEGVYIGANDPNNLGQVFVQLAPSTQWNITHTLQFVPNIVIVDSEGVVIEGFYEYIDENEIQATFSEAISGTAYLS